MTFQPFTDFTDMTNGEMKQYLSRVTEVNSQLTVTDYINEKGYVAYKIRNSKTRDMTTFELGDTFDIFQHRLRQIGEIERWYPELSG